ncbi:hypothetical protein HMPREF0591_1782, partial [Mycobacterium parascrofulaceum ATCC BAA-614]
MGAKPDRFGAMPPRPETGRGGAAQHLGDHRPGIHGGRQPRQHDHR